MLYVAAALLAYLPLLICAALLSPFSITSEEGPHTLPFLQDWTTMFTSLVAFPCMLILTVTDQRVLTDALKKVQADGTLTISEADRTALNKRWHRLFLLANLTAQALGLIIGSLVAYVNFKAFSPPDVGHWMAHGGRVLPVGYVLLCFLVLFWTVVSVYVVRNFTIALLLRDVVARAKLHMLPLHPDKAGGLKPVGRLGLRNQYALAVCGVSIVLMFVTSYHYLHVTKPMLAIGIAAIIAYAILGPVVFMAPLLPFRDGMLKNKAELMNDVAVRLRGELDLLRERLRSGTITAEDEQVIERLRKIALSSTSCLYGRSMPAPCANSSLPISSQYWAACSLYQ
jgi:hypothetical protein